MKSEELANFGEDSGAGRAERGGILLTLPPCLGGAGSSTYPLIGIRTGETERIYIQRNKTPVSQLGERGLHESEEDIVL